VVSVSNILVSGECPFLAVSRSSASSSERQLWIKQTLKLDISAGISDPKPPVETAVSRIAKCPD
jgi:hypothetical protein